MKLFTILVYLVATIIVTLATDNTHSFIIEQIEDTKEKDEVKYSKVTDEESPLCYICYNQFPVVMKYDQCGHECCAICYETMRRGKNLIDGCPMCRKKYSLNPDHYENRIYLIPSTFKQTDLQQVLPFVCQSGNLETVKKWMSLGLKPNKKGIFGYYPIHLCTTKEMIKYFENELQADMTVKKDDNEDSGFICSVFHGFLDVVKYWIEEKRENVHQKDTGALPIGIASTGGFLELAKYLISQGADATERDLSGYNALTRSIAYNHLRLVKYFIEEVGVDIDDAEENFGHDDGYGMTALLESCFCGHMKIVEYLIEHGATIDKPDKKGLTALHWVCRSENGNVEIAKYLIEKGLHVDTLDKLGMTPLHWAAENDHVELLKYFLSIKKSIINQTDCAGFTALCNAASRNKINVIKYLIEEGADVNSAQFNAPTPLCFSSQEGFLDIVKCLIIDGKADVNKPFKDGTTPLHLAACCGHMEVVKFLTSNGANLCPMGINVPFKMAQSNHHYEIAEFLKKKMHQRIKDEKEKIQRIETERTMDETLDNHRCAICDKFASKRCSRCKQVWYCCGQHQKDDWKTHMKDCVQSKK